MLRNVDNHHFVGIMPKDDVIIVIIRLGVSSVTVGGNSVVQYIPIVIQIFRTLISLSMVRHGSVLTLKMLAWQSIWRHDMCEFCAELQEGYTGSLYFLHIIASDLVITKYKVIFCKFYLCPNLFIQLGFSDSVPSEIPIIDFLKPY